MTVQAMCDRIERLAREGTPPVPQTGWVPLPPDALPGGDDADALWRDWDRVVQAADPRFECEYDRHQFWVRAVRDHPWPVEVREDRSFRLLLALHRSRLRGEASVSAARAASDAGLAESTASQALGELARRGLAEGLGRRAYRLALDPAGEIWLTPSRGPGRLTTLAAEAARRSLEAGGAKDVPIAGVDSLGVDAGDVPTAGPVDAAGLLGAVEEQIAYHEAQREHHEAQRERSAAMAGRLSAQRDRLRALLGHPRTNGSAASQEAAP